MKTGLTIFLAFLFFGVGGFASDTIVIGGLDGIDPYDTTTHPEIQLALSGGGARGLAAIGVLRAFEERGIRVQAIVGTSMGGIIGGLYASGYSAEELDDIVMGLNFSDLFASAPSRATMFLARRHENERHLISLRFDGLSPQIPRALTSAQSLTTLLTDLTARACYRADGDFRKFPIPFLTLATDIVTGEEVVLDSGSLADAMRATMAFPLAFTGIKYKGHLLMDGGILRPVPVDLARELIDENTTDTFVVAINTTAPLRPPDGLVTPIDIANQVTSIMTAGQLKRELARADFVITPALVNLTTTDFQKKKEIIAIGYEAGLVAADSILGLSRWTNHSQRIKPAGGRIDGVDVTFEGSPFDSPLTRGELIKRMKRFAIEQNLFSLEATYFPAIFAADQTENPLQGVDLHFTAQATPLVDSIKFQFSGNKHFNDSTLLAACDFTDSLLTAPFLQRGLDRIVNHYRVEGYDLADIRSVVVDLAAGEITIEVDEGVIWRIDVSHNKRTHDWLIRSYFPLKVGEPFTLSRSSHGIASIYGTDLFDRVTMNLIRTRKGLIVDIGVDEKPHLQSRLGWHWDDEYESEEFIEILNDNAHGIGLEYLAHARYGVDRQKYFGAIRADRIFSSYVTARLRLYHERLNRTTYNNNDQADGIRKERQTGGVFTAGQHISRLGTVSAALRFEHVSLEDSRFPGRSSFDLRTISLQSQVETFDRVPFPIRGQRQVFQLDLTGKLFGGDVEYTRVFSSLEAYFPFGQRLNYHPKISVGFSRSGLPPSQQFYLGGLHSFSGYRTDQLAGDKLLLLNQEIRMNFPLRLYVIARYDIGEVYASSDQIKLRNLRHGFGISVAVDSPLGPFEFGYGIANSDSDRFYFSGGYSF